MSSRISLRWETGIEISTWAIIILVLAFFKFLPQEIIGDELSLILVGAIIGFALIYYLVIYKLFSRSKRFYLKSLADIVFIGILLHFARDFNNILYSLYFLPILSAILVLEFFNSLVIVTVAALMIVFELLLNYYSGPISNSGYESANSAWQIFFLVIISLFVRFLSIQLQREKRASEEASLEKKTMIKASHRLQNPLSIIRAYSSSLKEGDVGKLSPNQKEYMEIIHKKSVEMIKIVKGIIKINKKEEEQINKLNNQS